MKQARCGTRTLLAAMPALGILLSAPCAAQDPAAADFIVPTTDRQCDAFNRSWVVASRHTHLSIKVRVKWSAVGAKEMEEEFILTPGGNRAIGCAAKLEVLSAEIMQF